MSKFQGRHNESACRRVCKLKWEKVIEQISNNLRKIFGITAINQLIFPFSPTDANFKIIFSFIHLFMILTISQDVHIYFLFNFLIHM